MSHHVPKSPRPYVLTSPSPHVPCPRVPVRLFNTAPAAYLSRGDVILCHAMNASQSEGIICTLRFKGRVYMVSVTRETPPS